MYLRELNFLAPTRAEIREVYNKTRLPWEGATEQAWSNKINKIAEIALDSGITDQQALSFNSRNNVNDFRETMLGRAYAESQLANTVGGLPAIDQMIQGFRSSDSVLGGFARATGNIPRSDISNILAASSGMDNFVSNIAGSHGLAKEAGVDFLSGIVAGTPEQQMAFRSAASGANDGELREMLASGTSAGASGLESAVISGFTKAGDKIAATISSSIIQGLSGVTIMANGSGIGGAMPVNVVG